ncbi:hypothetical protein FHS68_002634 [Dyadobacter arcticus]|uniref:Uncharacterized protein n=1 Tax=Dyadobacter arcticus TaxID=1078754 RepID=A0ABX0UKD7_9BACT|nr:hypothetical protein [Dyadobacter arcticus]
MDSDMQLKGLLGRDTMKINGLIPHFLRSKVENLTSI